MLLSPPASLSDPAQNGATSTSTAPAAPKSGGQATTSTTAVAPAAASAEETQRIESQPSRRKMVETWSALLLHGSALEGEGVTQDLKFEDTPLPEGSEEDEQEDRAIVQDVTRTRSGTPALRDPKVRRWLQRSVSRFCRERGVKYAQGLTELAVPWALMTEPPCLDGFSYRCFCSFVDQIAPNIFLTATEEETEARKLGVGGMTRTFVVLEAHLVLLEQLLRFHDPALAACLDMCCVSPAAYATPWFVTVFARHTPVPALLHLWRRLTEYGDPVLHQFLALGWLLKNRQELLELPQEDVLRAITRSRLQSAEDVDRLFGSAMALRASTPRLFCHVLRSVCYARVDDAAAVARHEGQQEGEGGEAPSPGSGEVWTSSGNANSADSTARWRLSLLEGLKATGVLLVGADQVAEILLAHHPLPSGSAATSAPAAGGETVPNVSEGDASESSSRSRVARGAKFILVDCRSSPEGDLALFGSGGEAAGAHVAWRRIHPAKSLGREAAAVVEVLQESGPRNGGAAEELPAARGAVRVGQMPGVVGDDSGSSSSAGVVQTSSDGDVDGDPAAKGLPDAHGDGRASGVGDGGGAPAQTDSGGGDAETTKAAPVDESTHVCFVGDCGSGGLRESGDGVRYPSSSVAAEGSAAAPEFRLARAASTSCRTTRVCVLQGGFSALEEALRGRRGSEKAPEGCNVGVVSVAVDGIVGDGDEGGKQHSGVPYSGAASIGSESTAPLEEEESLEEEATVPAAAAGRTTGGGREQRPRSFSGRGSSSASAEPDREEETPEMDQVSPPNSVCPRGGGGEKGAGRRAAGELTAASSPFIKATSRGLERKASRLAGNQRITEPFRAFAAKSSGEMGRALRSLPVAASKPLEDSARVCSSVAKTNVRAIGDSHMSLSRSMATLEQLNVRMSGTASGFARYFGSGLVPNGQRDGNT